MANLSALTQLKDLIASVESVGVNRAGDGYDTYNYGPSGASGFSSNPPVTSLTIKEVQDSQNNIKLINGRRLFAVGRYQITPPPLEKAAEFLKLSLTQKLDKDTQSKLGDWLILEKRPELGRYIKGLNGGSKKDLEDAVQALGQEFAPFPIITKSGKTYGDVEAGTGDKAFYGGVGPNPDTAKLTVKEVAISIVKTRVEYSDKAPSYFPPYYNGPKGSTSTNQNVISGKVVDGEGQPVAGVTVKIEPSPSPQLSEPTLNSDTGKYEVKDENGNIVADSIDKETARKQASTKTTQQSKQQAVNNPSPLPQKTPTYIVYRQKREDIIGTYPPEPDGAVITFEISGPQKTAILTPSDPALDQTPIKYSSFTSTYEGLAQVVFDIYKSKIIDSFGYYYLDIFFKPDPSLIVEQIKSAPKPDENSTFPVTVTTDNEGNWKVNAPSTFDPKNSTVIFSKEGHEITEKTNIQQTGGDTTGGTNKQYNIPRITIAQTPDTTATATNKLNQEILTEETALIKQQGESELSAQERLANSANKQKEELKKTIIPFIIKLLSQFGGVALQAILSKIPLDKIIDQISCPSQAKLLELINKRNKLVKQVNNAYKTVTTLTKTLRIVDSTLTAVQAGIAAIEALPYPATGIPPLGLPPLTSGIIETTGSGKDALKESLKKAKVAINIVTLALAAFGAILGIVLRLLNNLDVLIQQCSEEQDIPFDTVNDELNTFVNQSTGISNSNVIQTTQEGNTYKEFKLEIKLDTSNSSKYPRRFAQALNKIGIPVLKTESSFASDPQVLLDQLKFIIDSNPQLTAE